MSLYAIHEWLQRRAIMMIVGVLGLVSVGGTVEIAPLFMIENTIEKVEGMRPYTPLELAGRQIYIREGCYLCHSQQIRPFRDEVERYGPYSLAAESMYDHPFQWGSKRTGPDLARVGAKYSDDWQVRHLVAPRSLVPDSVMPNYGFLMGKPLKPDSAAAHLRANRALGVPYTDEMIAAAKADLLAQTKPDSDAAAALAARYPKVNIRDFDGDPTVLSEMDAMVAYLQMLGTLVDFPAARPNRDFLR